MSTNALRALGAALLAAACAAERTQVYVIPREVLEDSMRVLRVEIAERFAAHPDSLVVHSGRRLRLVYLDTLRRAPAPSTLYDYAADSTRYRQAFDQAVWLWTRFGRRAGVDTISVSFTLHSAVDLYTHSEEFHFYPAQLRHPDRPPLLGRGAVPRIAER